MPGPSTMVELVLCAVDALVVISSNDFQYFVQDEVERWCERGVAILRTQLCWQAREN